MAEHLSLLHVSPPCAFIALADVRIVGPNAAHCGISRQPPQRIHLFMHNRHCPAVKCTLYMYVWQNLLMCLQVNVSKAVMHCEEQEDGDVRSDLDSELQVSKFHFC